jgi:hypothetical protein
MEKHCGVLGQVGSLQGGQLVAPIDQYGRAKYVGSFRVATQIDAIHIGDTVLKKPRCEDELYGNLQPGREACIYVYRHFVRTPVILGIKYKDDGAKHLISSRYFRGALLQYATVLAMMTGIGGFVGVMIVGAILGRNLGNNFLNELLPVLGMVGGVGYSWWSAVRLWKDFQLAKSD